MGADPALSPALIEAQAFTTGFRGYDQGEVRQFLGRVAAEIRSLRERADGLESAWHSAEERAARPPVLDEETLMEVVGEEMSSILRTARTAAVEMRSRAAQETERVVADAEARAAQIRAEAEALLARERTAAEEVAARVVESARTEAAETLDKARMDADAIRASAQQDKTLTIEGAIATRERILEDLSRRRRVAAVQIEQLRAGRERLLESYGVVRRTLEEVNDELNRADTEARAAADEVGRRMQRDHPAEVPDAGDGAVEVTEAADADDAALDGPATAAAPASEPDPQPDPAPEPEPRVTPPPAAGPTPAPASVGAGRGGAKRRGRGGAPAGAEALATAVDHPPEASNPPEAAAAPHLRVVPDSHEPPAGAGEGPTTAVDDTTPPGSKVEVLFARIRAGRSDEDPAAEPEAPSATVVAEQLTPYADEVLLQRREAAVIEIESSLTRKLKRTMQDEQNDLLDRLRSLRGEPTSVRLLPDLATQVAQYAHAAQPLVERSATAGVAFAAEILDRKGRPHPSVPVVTDLATEAATTIVEALRRRLEHAIAASGGDEQSVLVEALGAAYREWKSERIERIAGDVLTAAFSRGTWHEVPDGTSLRWIVEDTDGPCPDCDDDALAGNLPKGEVFPTGQPYPPAHTGCRCLLVPVTG